MTYQGALERVNSRLRFGIKPGLDRIAKLLALLGNPQEKVKMIHIAGTNGKGSTSALVASALTACGYRTGLFTSPYVVEFRERFQIDRCMISEEALIDLVAVVDAAAKRLEADNEPVTEFEFITAMAFLWFYRSNCDFVVLEVGLGGRFDATNVISAPEVAAIMQISLDHTAILGDTVEQIAFEKAGIIKPGGTVVMYPGQSAGAAGVIADICKDCGAKLLLPEMDAVEIKKATIHGTTFVYDGMELSTPFAGAHQVRNAITAYTVLWALSSRGVSLSREQLTVGFRLAEMPGRMEVLSDRPLLILDGGHNPGCAGALQKLLADFTPGYRRIAVMGMMADKDVTETLRILGPMFTKIIATAPSQPRAMPAADFAEIAREFCESVEVCGDVKAVAKVLREICDEKTAVVVCGSFYLVGEFRNFFKNGKLSESF